MNSRRSTRPRRSADPLSLQQALRNYLRRPASERAMTLHQYLAAYAPLAFAHHREEDGLPEHTFLWRGLYLCRGCVMASIGILIGIAAGLSTSWVSRISTWELAAALTAMVAPTVLTTLWQGPRPLRDACRLVLGVAVGSSLAAMFLVDSWLVKLIIAFAFVAGRKILGGHRRRKMART
jgi:hypothetical protein